MNVLLISPHYPPEIRSVSVLMSQLAEDLAARGHAVTVLAPYPPSHMDEAPGAFAPPPDAGRAVRVVRVPVLPFVKVPRAVRAVTHFTLAASMVWYGLRAGRHDAVIVYSPPLPLALAAETLAERWGAPLVVNVQDIYPQTLIDLGLARNPVVLGVLRWLERRAYRRASALTVHSEGNRALLLSRGVDAAKISVIPNWVDTGAAPPPDPNPYRVDLALGDRVVVLFAGVMGYAQDMAVIVEAAGRLRDDPRIVFLLAGDGVRRAEAEALASAQGLANVRFLPFQAIDRYPVLVAAADCCLVTLQAAVGTPVVPSKIAGILGQGRPVVAALPDGDARELVARSGGGVCVAPGDAAALAAAIRELAAHPEHRRALGESGRRFVEAHFSRHAATGLYAALLERLTAPGRAGIGAGAANLPKRS
ncbi:MAG TPA: glycosyltransferase family 4 protein [bacterium]|nr:glycosyltransferase family 4 protein [bacterium]